MSSSWLPTFGLVQKTRGRQLRGWSGGAMMLGKLLLPGHPTIWITVGQGPTARAAGAVGGCLDIFTLIYPFFPLSPSLGGGRVVRWCWVNFQCRGVLKL